VVWHFTRPPHLIFNEDKSDRRIYVFGSGIDIYTGPSVDDHQLTDLNLMLEKDTNAIKTITETYCEFKVRYITKNDVTLTVLRPHKGKEEAMRSHRSPRHRGSDAHHDDRERRSEQTYQGLEREKSHPQSKPLRHPSTSPHPSIPVC
jgi:hypothetical protein